MKKTAIESSSLGGAHASETAPEGARERLLRAFLRELPGQLDDASQRWSRTVQGDAAGHTALDAQLQRLKGEATLLGLAGHAHLFSALADAVAGRTAGTSVSEHIAVAVRMALRAVGELEGPSMARAEREAAQLRWLCHGDGAIVSGVFPRHRR